MGRVRLRYSDAVEEAIEDLSLRLHGAYNVSHRFLSLLLLQGDPEAEALVRETDPEHAESVLSLARTLSDRLGANLDAEIHRARVQTARVILSAAVREPVGDREALGDRLGRWCTQPFTGIPILLVVVAAGLYGFVGVLGGQIFVGWLEGWLFEGLINPTVSRWVQGLGVAWLSKLIVGEYGVWTLGVTYAFGLILPLITTFFLAFSVLEDSGYLPRLAMLVDRLFKSLGLNGRAVIPLILGFGCDTVATIVTRILETRRERILATFLLSLAIPCSAQLGVMTGLLADKPLAFVLWVAIMTVTFLLMGYLAAQVLPGERPPFVQELPPMRWPSPANVAAKTLSRMYWYFLEVVPLFLMASVILWVADLSGALRAALRALEPVVRLLGLPPKAGEALLFGFFRRDYGAAGLYRLHEHHGLTGNQQLVAAVTLTLFLPCIAQLLVMRKERGTKASLAMVLFIFPFAITVGALLNWLLSALGVQL